MRYSIVICMLLAAANARAEPLPVADSLRAFESRLRETEAFRAGRPLSELPVMSRSVVARALPGATLFASTSFASVDEVVDVGRSRAYDQAAVSAGIRVPLLGSRARQIDELDDAAIAEASAEAEFELRRRELVALVRQTYVDYWSANARRELASAYLADRSDFQAVLLRRTAAGLLLESDRLEFMASFASAAAELARSEAELRSAATILTSVTHTQPAARVAPFSATPEACISFDVEAHPEIRALASRAAHFERRNETSAWKSIQSELRLGYTHTEETTTGAPGSSAFVSLSFDYAFDADRSRARTDRMRRDSAVQRLAVRRQQLELESERLRTMRAVVIASTALARQATEAAEAKYRERSLRAAKLAGDVIEQRLQARYALYRARLAEQAATREYWDWRIAATTFEDSVCDREPDPEGTATVSVTTQVGRGVYVWSPEQLLAALDTPKLQPIWQRLDTLKIRRLLLSFNREELARFRRDPQRLVVAIEALQRRGYAVEWLLGEPTWMLPSKRGDLLQLLDAFANIPFDAIHLDLEPNQLDAAQGDGREHLDDLLQTIAAVRVRTSKPIGLSLHPRYLTMQVGDRAFGEQVARLDVKPTLMIYVANANRVVEIATPLRDRWPRLAQAVAVSLEHELDEHHSVEHLSAAALEEHLATLERRLSGEAFGGLVLQPSAQWLYATDNSTGKP